MNISPSKKKCFANCHLTPEEYGFWDVCRSLSYRFKGNLIFDGRTVAGYFGDTGKNTAYRLCKLLCAKEWLVCTKKSVHNGKGGHNTHAEYKVLSHDEWLAKHGTKHCKSPVPESGLEQAEGPFDESQNRDSASPRTGNEPVPEPGHQY